MRQVFRFSPHTILRDYSQKPWEYEYPFIFYHEETAYVPILSYLMENYMDNVYPIAIKQRTTWSTAYYMDIISSTNSDRRNFFLKRITQGGNRFLSSFGAVYKTSDRGAHRLMPIFVTVLPNTIYQEHKDVNDTQHFIDRCKKHLQVLIHNHLTSVNKTLWKHIRKSYIPLLTLEGIQFRFMAPEEIMRLTTVGYEKPKFSSLKEMEEFKRSISTAADLKNASELMRRR